MAKRKRLSPLGVAYDDAPDLPDAEPRAALSPALPLSRQAPIADMAGAAAATAALEEMADTLRQAKETGRMVLALPLAQVEAGHLVRDRLVSDPEDMAALVESLRQRGQQTPIEVVALGPDRFGLISGWRRLRALSVLLAETGDTARFGSVLALLRKPEQASDAYVAMVEENEIRVGLSFYERARITAKAVEVGVYADEKAALRGLFQSASRAKRSKIGSFVTVVRALDGALRFPEAIGERLGLQLAQALEAGGDLAARLRAALEAAEPADAAAEQALIARLIAPAKEPAAKPVPRPSAQITGSYDRDLAPGLHLRAAEGRVLLEGDKVDETLLSRLVDWLESQSW